MPDDTPWLDPDERGAWVALVRTMLRLPATLDTQLQREAGVTFFEYLVIAMLSETDDRTLQMSELADLTAASLSRLSHVVSRMESRGLVRRERIPGTGRRTAATLTDEGLALIEGAAPDHVVHVRSLVVDAVDRDDLAAVRRVAERISERIDDERSGPTR